MASYVGQNGGKLPPIRVRKEHIPKALFCHARNFL